MGLMDSLINAQEQGGVELGKKVRAIMVGWILRDSSSSTSSGSE
jgi:hypothetical protein